MNTPSGPAAGSPTQAYVHCNLFLPPMRIIIFILFTLLVTTGIVWWCQNLFCKFLQDISFYQSNALLNITQDEQDITRLDVEDLACFFRDNDLFPFPRLSRCRKDDLFSLFEGQQVRNNILSWVWKFEDNYPNLIFFNNITYRFDGMFFLWGHLIQY